MSEEDSQQSEFYKDTMTTTIKLIPDDYDKEAALNSNRFGRDKEVMVVSKKTFYSFSIGGLAAM